MNRRGAETHVETLRWHEEKDAQRVARGAAPVPYPNDSIVQDLQQSPQQHRTLDPSTENLSSLIDHAESSDLEVFGFVLFRTHYFDQPSLVAFEKRFWELLDEGITNACAGSEFNRVEDRVFIRIVSVDSLEGQPAEGVLRAYSTCMDDDETTVDDGEGD